MTNADPQQRDRGAVRLEGLRPLPSHRFIAAALLTLVATMVLVQGGTAQTQAWVDTGGDCLWLRAAPGLSIDNNITCMDHGEPITLLEGEEDRDGFTWQRAEYEGETGWVATFYITTDPSTIQVLYEASTDGPGGIPVPPSGGLTMGLAGVTSPSELAAAQPYEVVSIWHFDLQEQRLFHHIPGAPEFVNTLESLTPESVVVIRRAGSPGTAAAVPDAPLTVAGTPRLLWVPPIGGMTQGVSGTTDPHFLVLAQDFTAESVAYFHIESQTWLTYISGAPEYANTLQQGHLRVDSIVSVRRGPDAPRQEETSEESDYFETAITYYYCVPGENPASIGDGGGYCGVMANGEQVHEGAAACAPRHLGQRFRIEGDPTGRTYTCTDAGGSVLHDHRDIWFMHSDEGYAWWVQVGDRAYIEIIRDGQQFLYE